LASKDEVVTIYKCSRVAVEVVKEWTQDRLAKSRRSLVQRVQVRHQPIPEANRLANGRENFKVQPGGIRFAAGLPGVHDEARTENTVLDPTHEQLRIRNGTEEATDVVPGVEHAGQAHRQAHPKVPAQRVPARRVVAGPCLRVALDARRTRTRHSE